MKRNERNALKELSLSELKVHINELEEKLFKLKISNSMAPLKNGLQIRNLKKERARLLTWIHQKEATKK